MVKTIMGKKQYRLAVMALLMALCSGCGAGSAAAPADTQNVPQAEETAAGEEKAETAENTAEAETDTDTAKEQEEADTAEPSEASAELSDEEMKKIEEDLNSPKYNGFVASEFASPELIYWEQVFYVGAGLDTAAVDREEVMKAFMKEAGLEELDTDITFVGKGDVEAFVKSCTGMEYKDMKHPLNWMYLESYGVYCHAHGDTNFMKVEVLSGKREGDTLTIDYRFEPYEGEAPEDIKIFKLIANEGPDGYVFVSNLWAPEGGREAGIAAIYDEIIQKYATGVRDNWDSEKFDSNNLSSLAGLYTTTRGIEYDPMEKLGYAYHDIDSDGIEELFIGANSEGDTVESLFEVYSVRSGYLQRVLRADESSRYYLSNDETFYNEITQTPLRRLLVHQFAEDDYKFLADIDGVICDEEYDSKAPWFYSDENVWETDGAKPISEKEYNDYVEKAGKSYVALKYTPFSSVETK